MSNVTHPCWCVENHAQDSRCNFTKDNIVPTLHQKMGTGGNNVPLVLIKTDAEYLPRILNSSGGGISATIVASYYKGAGTRNGEEREFVAILKEVCAEKADPG